MEKETTHKISTKNLLPNKGQIYGLPKNPRFIKDDRFAALVKSISDDPEMMDLRPLIVYPFDDGGDAKFIVIGGNDAPTRVRRARLGANSVRYFAERNTGG